MVGWTTFQAEALSHKIKHPYGHPFPLVAKRNISLLGLLATIGQASSAFIETDIKGQAVVKTQRELLVGRLYWYLFQYYETLSEYGTMQRVPIAIEDAPPFTLIWRITQLILQMQELNTPVITVEKTYDIVDVLKRLEANIHQLAASYKLSLTDIRVTLLNSFKPKSDNTLTTKHKLLVEDIWVLKALHSYAVDRKLPYFLVTRNNISEYLPATKITHERFKQILKKLEIKGFLGRIKKQLYITKRAENLLCSL